MVCHWLRKVKSVKLIKNKICTVCGEGFLPTAEYFYKDVSMKSGLCSKCKGCMKKIAKEFRQSERGRRYHLQYNRKYRSTVKGYLHNIFSHMKERCNSPNHPSYKNYGGRGIKVCFISAIEFVTYVMGVLQVDPRGLQCDRIDNDGNYERGNVRFVTRSENNLNKRNIGNL